jgi:hypothetical protein
MTTTNNAVALLRLRNFDERVIDGAVWTRQDGEFKVSPHGLTGDYDRDCFWVPRKDVADFAK